MVLPIIFGLMLQLDSSADSGRSVLEFLSDNAGTTNAEESMAMELHGLADVELTVAPIVRGATKDDERWDLVFVVHIGSLEKVVPRSVEAAILKKWAHDRGNLFTNDRVLYSTASVQKLGLAADFDVARLLREVAQVRREIEEWPIDATSRAKIDNDKRRIAERCENLLSNNDSIFFRLDRRLKQGMSPKQ